MKFLLMAVMSATLLSTTPVLAKKSKSTKKTKVKKTTLTTTTRTTMTTTTTTTTTKKKKKKSGVSIDLDDTLEAMEEIQLRNEVALELEHIGAGRYQYLGIMMEENDDKWSESNYEDALTDAMEITDQCIETYKPSLHSIASCLNQDVHEEHMLNAGMICRNTQLAPLREALREGPNYLHLRGCN